MLLDLADFSATSACCAGSRPTAPSGGTSSAATVARSHATPFAGALGFGSPLSLPYALDVAVPALRSALDGTPADL